VKNKEIYTDKELFALIAQEDEEAFEQLFYRYLAKLQLVILKVVKNETVVNDIIQEVFLSIWIDRERLTEVESPSRWIFRIMYNRSLSWLERQTVREKAKGTIIHNTREAANDTEEAVFFAETSRLIREAIRRLPGQTRKIYLLSRESGLKIPEIAEKLDLSPHTVKNTLVRAGKSIQNHLKKNGILLPLLLFIFR
jgi:RNA polymerase sigma-70 factor (ECF subfamily)